MLNEGEELNDELYEELNRMPQIDAARFDARVRGAIAAEGRRERPLHHLGLWAAALAAVALLMIIPEAPRHDTFPHGSVASSDADNPAADGSLIQFSVSLPGASTVSVVGSFNGWDRSSTPLRRSADGTWSATVRLPVGRYVYQFVVDGQRWMIDPRAELEAPDDFGASNSVVTVTSGAT